MPKLPRLDNLIRPAVMRGHNPDRIFNTHFLAWMIREQHKKIYCGLLSPVGAFFRKPSRPACA